MSSEKVYYAWVVTPCDDFAEPMVAKLVRRGYTIGPLGGRLVTKHDDNPACVIAFKLARSFKSDAERDECSTSGIQNEITDVIKRLKGKTWATVVTDSTNCTWNIGNISLLEEARLAQEELKKIN